MLYTYYIHTRSEINKKFLEEINSLIFKSIFLDVF